MMGHALLAALALLCWAGPAHGIEVDATRVTFGTTFSGPKTFQVKSAKPFTIAWHDIDGWCWHPGLTVAPLGGVGPVVVTVNVPPATARRNEVDHTYLKLCDADGCAILDVRVSCSGETSGSNACGQPPGNPSGSRPSCVLQPTAVPTATGDGPRPTSSSVPLPQRTASVAPPIPTAERTPGLPQPTVTAAPPSGPLGGQLAAGIPWKYVSISPKVPDDFLRWCPRADGTFVSCDQVGADAMEGTRELAAQAAMRLWDALPDSADDVANAMNKASGRSHVYDLWACYRTNFCGGKGDWGTDKNGKLYSIAYRWSWKLNHAITADPDGAGLVCGSWPEAMLPNPDPMGAPLESPLLDFLDLHIEQRPKGPTCVYGARFAAAAYPPASTYESRALTRGLIDYEMVLPALTPEQKALALATHHAHHAVTAWHCGGAKPADGIVAAAHAKLQATCRNPTECKVFAMIPFSGVFHAAYGPPGRKTERCAIAIAQDKAHGRWLDALLALDGRTPGLWLPLELANIDHAELHQLANFRHAMTALTLFDRFTGKAADLKAFAHREWFPELMPRLVRDAEGYPLVLEGGQP